MSEPVPVALDDTDPMPWSDSNDADQFDPKPAVGRVPDHTATADDSSPVSLDKPGGKMPWERAADWVTSAPKTPRVKKDTGPVPNLPKSFGADLADVYRTIGAMLSPFDPICGTAIINSADDCAEKLVALARTNADVRRVLLKLVGTSALGAVIAAHMPILMAIAMHHVAPLMVKQAPPDETVNPVSNGYHTEPVIPNSPFDPQFGGN